MMNNPWDVLTQFPVRKTKQQKQEFRDAVKAYAEGLGYSCTVERRNASCQNLVIGDPEKAGCLVTAHYDTCARLPFPNFITPCNLPVFVLWQMLLVLLIFFIAFVVGVAVGFVFHNSEVAGIAAYLSAWLILILMQFGPANKNNANDNTSGVITLLEIARTMPESQRHKVCFVLFDMEEAGLIGSSFYRKRHRKATENQIVLNLDCVGDGDHLMMFPTGKLKKDRKMLTSLYKACGYFGKKSLLLREKGFSVYPSDQMHFPYGVGICALNKGKLGLYMGRIHTHKDTVLEQTNVNILRSALITYICCNAVKEERK